jgi:hypothetical protein
MDNQPELQKGISFFTLGKINSTGILLPRLELV